ncbi:MAG: lysophospholipid acyltransferase family protein [Fimbriimonas ginsengisoli]|uniref:Lysophospholipid acyltransferase family protein n=1 Tax=Fimbriimonas ginsengisoli TaxID=1005039 RepID=A0A931LW78_FIMGI|nr:lysophospholipid acyltransferase family protein [Fimbriimonas ginsengisoli]MBI3721823.1 lysophospholipid acyltransferase family protein [Fimbriimonas ginsengisoli]
MISRRKAFERRAGAWLFALFERRFSRKDAIAAEESGARLGRLAYRLSRKHRRRALANLALAMPELEPSERERIARGVFEHFGRITGDFMRSGVRSDSELLQSLEVVGMEHADEARSLGTGLLAVTGHFGNWERMAHWFAAQGGTITVVARDANDPGLNQQVQRLRNRPGFEVLSRGRSTRTLIERLKEGAIVALLPDQNSGESFVPFFGKPAGTVLGPAKLHQMTGAPLLPVFCARTGPARYQVRVFPVINVGKAECAEAIMARINLAIEEIVREYPDQWLWLHDRWRSARERGLF